MIQIKVIGNIKYFKDQYDQAEWWKFATLSIIGSFGPKYHVLPYNFIYDEDNTSLNWFDLKQMADKIRGCDVNQLFDILQEYEIRYPATKRHTYQEIGLIKALINILIWLEGDLIGINRSSVIANLYNEFIIDFSPRKSIQEDIYFVPREIADDDANKQNWQILSLLNLVCQLEISWPDGAQIVSYFLPFYKIGVTRMDFMQVNPNQGNEAFELYRKLLNYRDTKLNNFINKK